MFKLLTELKGIQSSKLYAIADVFNKLSRSIIRLAEEQQKLEEQKKQMESVKMTLADKRRLQKLRYARAIMTRYMAGQSYDQIAAAMGCHPKTIYKQIRKVQTDLQVLKEIERDILNKKMSLAKNMVSQGKTKKEIVRNLNISAYYVTAIRNQAELT